MHRYAHFYAALFEYLSTARAGWHAAQLWLYAETDLSPAHFRDQPFQMHCADRQDCALKRRTRRNTFCQAFAEVIDHILVEEGRLCAASA